MSQPRGLCEPEHSGDPPPPRPTIPHRCTTAGGPPPRSQHMPKVTFHHDGDSADVLDVAPGTSLMRAAVREGVRGIVGECGGQAMCAPRPRYVREAYLGAPPRMGEGGGERLEGTPAPP